MSTPPPNNMPPRDNLYYDLELFLDPPEVDFNKLKNVLRTKITEWNKLAAIVPAPKCFQYNHMVQVAEEFCKRTTAPGSLCGEPAKRGLENQAKEARVWHETNGKKKAGQLENGGVLHEKKYNNFLKKYQLFFKHETIKSWFSLEPTILKPPSPFRKPIEPTFPPEVKEKIVEKSKMDDIAVELKIVCENENASLYNLLELEPTTNLRLIQQKQKAKYDEARRKPVSPKITAEISVLGKANKIFANESSRQGYDIALKRRPFDKLIDENFADRVLNTVPPKVSDDDYFDSIWEARDEAGLSQAEAEWYVYDYYCIKRKCQRPTRAPEIIIDREFNCLRKVFQLMVANPSRDSGQVQNSSSFSVERYVYKLRKLTPATRLQKLESDVEDFLGEKPSDVKEHLFFILAVDDFIRDLSQADPSDGKRCFELLEKTFLAKMTDGMKKRYFDHVSRHFNDPKNQAIRKKHLFLYLSLLLCLYADKETEYSRYFGKLSDIKFVGNEFRNFINEILDNLIGKAITPTVYEQIVQFHLAQGTKGKEKYDFIKEYDYFSRLQKYCLHLWQKGKPAHTQGAAFIRYVLSTQGEEWAFWKDQSNIVDSLLKIPMNDNKIKKNALAMIRSQLENEHFPLNPSEVHRLKYDLFCYTPPLQDFIEGAGKKTAEITGKTVYTLYERMGAFGKATWKKTGKFYPYFKWFTISTGKIFYACCKTIWTFGKTTWKAAWKKLRECFSSDRQQYVENCQQNVEKTVKMLGEKICDSSKAVVLCGKVVGKVVWKKTRDFYPYVEWFVKTTGQKIGDYCKTLRKFGKATWKTAWRKISEFIP